MPRISAFGILLVLHLDLALEVYLLLKDFAGVLPSLNLSAAMEQSEQSIQEQRDTVIKDFHLGDGFLRRLQQCLRKKMEELEDINKEMVLAEWQKEVHQVAESGRCFILSKLDPYDSDPTASVAI
eukprot:symbB.v1.2.038445.t1/scaffold5987.1/size21932/5